MFKLPKQIKLAVLASTVAFVTPTAPFAYPIDCAIFLCLAGGWPTSAEAPDCNAARAEFIRRITPYPVEPPLQLWNCPMGATSGSPDLSPMERLDAIKESSANPFPELPTAESNEPRVVDASIATETWTSLDQLQTSEWKPLGSSKVPWVKLGAGSPALPAHTLASVDFSTSDFDVVRSIRVWDVQHYSYRVREREGPCEARLDMQVGTYDANVNFDWSRGELGSQPDWVPLHNDCPSRFRGVGVEWSDTFGRHDYVLVPY